jgi:TRAP transporter TAXI family solute receptor
MARADGVGSPVVHHVAGSQFPIRAVLAIIVAVLMVGAAGFLYLTLTREEPPPHIVIATGPDSGTYHALGLAIARVLESEGVVASAEVRSTEGSVANMVLVGGADHRADLAFVQSDTTPAGGVRLLAPLYQEVMHILVAGKVPATVTTVVDLEGLRISMGTVGSGTRSIAERVIDHFGVRVGEDIALPPNEVAQGLEDGSIDAAFMLSAIPSPVIDELCERDAVRFLSLGDSQERGNEADALALVFPSLSSGVIPRSTYGGLPKNPVATIEVAAMLVAPKDLDPKFVTTVVSTLFAHRSKLIETETERVLAARRIREKYQPEAVLIPYHRGAVDYYQRAQPPFIVEYAETMSFVLTVLVGIFSIAVAIREWMRRKMKNRIDVFYVEVEDLTGEIQEMSLDELKDHRRRLRDLRRRAFAELVAERLEANESFTIFQDYLASERAAIEARIEEKLAESRLTGSQSSR